MASLTRFFAVQKGEDDIRMVYNGTASGLNDVLWAPNFGLPTVDSAARATNVETWMGDLDLGEMFLNFMIDPKIRPYCGVDLTPYLKDPISENDEGSCSSSDATPAIWERWERCLMGLKPSPYNAIQSFLWAEEIIRGSRRDPNNIFRWDRVRLNLPGDSRRSYDPTSPWVSKWLNDEGRIGPDFFSYVDDIQTNGGSEHECWRVAHWVALMCSFLGIQDAPRKRRPPSQQPGPWAGSVIQSHGNAVGVLTTLEKWEKTKRSLEWLRLELGNKEGLDRKGLEERRGFLVYVSRTYPAMVTFLKGIHLSLDK